jgi:hypothetical protein
MNVHTQIQKKCRNTNTEINVETQIHINDYRFPSNKLIKTNTNRYRNTKGRKKQTNT